MLQLNIYILKQILAEYQFGIVHIYIGLIKGEGAYMSADLRLSVGPTFH